MISHKCLLWFDALLRLRCLSSSALKWQTAAERLPSSVLGVCGQVDKRLSGFCDVTTHSCSTPFINHHIWEFTTSDFAFVRLLEQSRENKGFGHLGKITQNILNILICDVKSTERSFSYTLNQSDIWGILRKIRSWAVLPIEEKRRPFRVRFNAV